jgi:hypothetical protein
MALDSFRLQNPEPVELTGTGERSTQIEYQRLDVARNEFRILELQSAVEDDTVLKFDIFHEPVESAQYTALSYVWYVRSQRKDESHLSYSNFESQG